MTRPATAPAASPGGEDVWAALTSIFADIDAQGGVEADLTVTRLEDRGEDENDSYSGGSSSSSSSCYYFFAKAGDARCTCHRCYFSY